MPFGVSRRPSVPENNGSMCVLVVIFYNHKPPKGQFTILALLEIPGALHLIVLV